jgi:FMN phosphatase YigB (HAD superfamily)
MKTYKASSLGPLFVNSDRVACFDIDDTLVTPTEKLYGDSAPIEFGEPGRSELLFPITPHIKLLKEFAARDFFIIVWSDGGHHWARKVIERLGLTSYVDMIMSKPSWSVDDKEATEWIMKRTYLLK